MSASTHHNFELPTLALSTEFDEPVEALAAPGGLVRGHTALCVLDGANRGYHRLIRFVRPSGLAGVKLVLPDQDLRLTVRLVVDRLATSLWFRQQQRMAGITEFDEDDIPDLSDQHRLVEVSVQGRPRALALHASRASDPQWTVRQSLSMELRADDIDDSGLVVISFQQPEFVPPWLSDRLMVDSLVGMAVGVLKVEPLESPVRPFLSTGRPPMADHQVSPALPGGFVVNPSGGPTHLRLWPSVGADRRLLGRRAKVKHPVRAARQVAGDRRLGTAQRAVVDAVTMTGETLLQEQAVDVRDDGFHVVLPEGSGPAYVRARLDVGGELLTPDWGLRIVND